MLNFDYNATTPVSERVLAAMLPWFRERPANPASAHAAGRTARAAVERARRQVAEAVGASPSELIFTSGSTEATNIALRGVGGPVATITTEHKAVLDTAQAHPDGCRLVPVDARGAVDLDLFDEACRGAGVVSVMLANNETGRLTDISQIGEIARQHGCLVHTDATQALGKVRVDLAGMPVDLASFSAHKLHGPKGSGALFVRRGVRLASTMTGGGHEGGVRSGTLNVPGIVGFGAACAELSEESMRGVQVLVDRMVEGLRTSAAPVQLFSDHRTGLPNTVSIRFLGADGEAVMANAPTVAMSLGSACTSAVPEPSHVLLAMGVPASAAFETLRLSIGRETSAADVDAAVDAIVSAVQRVRALTLGERVI